MKALPSPRLAIATPSPEHALAKLYKLGASFEETQAMYASEAFKQAYALAYPLTGQSNAN